MRTVRCLCFFLAGACFARVARRGISPRGAPSGRPRPVLVPGQEGPQWWDGRNAACPVVLQPDEPQGALVDLKTPLKASYRTHLTPILDEEYVMFIQE